MGQRRRSIFMQSAKLEPATQSLERICIVTRATQKDQVPQNVSRTT
jgi:hypothetical protein